MLGNENRSASAMETISESYLLLMAAKITVISILNWVQSVCHMGLVGSGLFIDFRKLGANKLLESAFHGNRRGRDARGFWL